MPKQIHHSSLMHKTANAIPASAEQAGVLNRRDWLMTATALGGSIWTCRASASSNELDQALRSYAKGASISPGRVKLEISPLVDNGNTVPMTVSVDSPMTASNHVVSIAVFNEKNPQRDICRFVLGPRAGKASVSTRIRLVTTQKLVAVAQMNDGSYWSDTVDVIVTIAACLEDNI